MRKRRLFRDVDRITIPSADFREQITNPQNCASLPPLVAAALEAECMPEAVDEDAFDMALAWRRLPHWEHVPRATRAFVLARGHLFDQWLGGSSNPVARSGHNTELSDDTHSVGPGAPSIRLLDDPPTVSNIQAVFPSTRSDPSLRDDDSALDSAQPARAARRAAALIADRADIDLPEPGKGALAGMDWEGEARLAQLLRSGARPFVGGGGSSSSGGAQLASELLRGLESREFSVEELRALSSSKGGSSGLGTPAIERLRALASSGSLVDAHGNTVSAAQIWGKRGRDLDSLSSWSHDGSDNSQPGAGQSPPLLGPIRVLPTLREGVEEPSDSLMRDVPPGAPSPPPLALPSPPHLPLPEPNSSGFSSGPGSEPQGFGTEDFLTQRAPLRPSQVVTEQTTAVHAWLQEEQERQIGKRRRLSGGVERQAQHGKHEMSLLASTAGLSRSDAAKAFYQVLVLQSCRLVELRQAEPWGDIAVAL